jgi:hypothetical protein
LIATVRTYRADRRAGRGRPDRRGHPLLCHVRRAVLQGREPAACARRRNTGSRRDCSSRSSSRQRHDRPAERPVTRQQAAPDKVAKTEGMDVMLQPRGRRVQAEGRRQRQARRGRPEGPRSGDSRRCIPRRVRLHRPGPNTGSYRARSTWDEGRYRPPTWDCRRAMPGVFARGRRCARIDQAVGPRAVGEGAAAAIGS